MSVNPQFYNGSLLDLWHYRSLLLNLVIRDLKVRHKQSFLGIAWSMINPLLTMAILTLVFSHFFGASLRTGSFALYVISGLLPWNLFNQATSQGLISITSNGSIIRKVYVPKAVFPFAAVLSAVVTFGLSLIPMLIFIAVTGGRISWKIIFILVPAAEVMVLALGISLLLASMHVFFRDVKWFYESALLALFYATPIFYPPEIIADKLLPFLKMNPLVPLLNAFRAPLIDGSLPALSDLALGGAAALFFLITGWLALRKVDQSILNYL